MLVFLIITPPFIGISKMLARPMNGSVIIRNTLPNNVRIKACIGPQEMVEYPIPILPRAMLMIIFKRTPIDAGYACTFEQTTLLGRYTAIVEVWPKTIECKTCRWEIRNDGFYFQDVKE